jgi:hypothetical protein
MKIFVVFAEDVSSGYARNKSKTIADVLEVKLEWSDGKAILTIGIPRAPRFEISLDLPQFVKVAEELNKKYVVGGGVLDLADAPMVTLAGLFGVEAKFVRVVASNEI